MSPSVLRGQPPAPPQAQQGVALVIALLFTAVILMVVVSTTATMTLGAREGGANERQAYQALLNAESAQNTFPVRVNERFAAAPSSIGTVTALQDWLAPLNTYGEARLSFENISGTSGTFALDVVSAGGSGSALKKVVRSYQIQLGTLPLSFRPRAAVTSLPAINANGSARVTGTANDGPITTVRGNAPTLAAHAASLTLPVQDTMGILLGDYLTVSGATFRVDGKMADTLSLVRVPAPSPASTVLSGDVSLRLNAVAASTSSVTDPLELRISNVRDFVVGETVTVSGHTATVTQVNPAQGTALLDWTSGMPTALNEGEQVLRDIRALRSAWNIDPKANKLGDYGMVTSSGGAFVQDCQSAARCSGENDPLLRQTSSSDGFLTSMLLGLTDAELDAAVPLSTTSTNPRSTDPMVNAVRRINASDFDELIKNGTHSGLLIVDGDINSNSNGHTVFDGFLYFRGNHGGKFNGTLTVNGAVAVRGGPIEGLTSDDVDTNLTGNLTVNFNAVALRRQLLMARGLPQIQAQAGTWRQQ
ncbi:pilus assembly PilX N-terminal domain-containing protein [Deinococcus navajonensis]|uniref:Pilus assembly PilX N-terminal domain-containing protein n=1 Tax=Deinococcus navajonensis TaxID=309884 RepID=A0ABV8XV72_9DEIO